MQSSTTLISNVYAEVIEIGTGFITGLSSFQIWSSIVLVVIFLGFTGWLLRKFNKL